MRQALHTRLPIQRRALLAKGLNLCDTRTRSNTLRPRAPSPTPEGRQQMHLVHWVGTVSTSLQLPSSTLSRAIKYQIEHLPPSLSFPILFPIIAISLTHRIRV